MHCEIEFKPNFLYFLSLVCFMWMASTTNANPKKNYVCKLNAYSKIEYNMI